MMDQIPDLNLITPDLESILPLLAGTDFPQDLDSLQRYAELMGVVSWALAGLRYGQLPVSVVTQLFKTKIHTPSDKEWVLFLWDSFMQGDVVSAPWRARMQQVKLAESVL